MQQRLDAVRTAAGLPGLAVTLLTNSDGDPHAVRDDFLQR